MSEEAVKASIGDVRIVATEYAITIYEGRADHGRPTPNSVYLHREEAVFVRDQITAALAAGLVKP